MSIKDFDSPIRFAEHLLRLEAGRHVILGDALETSLVILEKDMVSQIGEYQDAVGPYPEWAPLADSTMEDKERGGYAPPDNPLLRDGDLRESFQHERNGLEGVVGSTDPKMEFHEFGTVKMPPRPVVGPALENEREKINHLLGRAVVNVVLGGKLDQVSSYFGDDIKP